MASDAVIGAGGVGIGSSSRRCSRRGRTTLPKCFTGIASQMAETALICPESSCNYSCSYLLVTVTVSGNLERLQCLTMSGGGAALKAAKLESNGVDWAFS